MAEAVSAPPAAELPASVGSAVPSSKGEIHVTPESVAAGAEPAKPGSAQERLFTNLRKKAAPETPVAAPAKPAAPSKPAAPTTPPKPATAAAATKEGEESPAGAEPGEETPPAATAAPISPEEKKKVSPWKLVEQFKKKALEAEQRALDLEKGVIPEEKRKEMGETFKRLQERNKVLEEEIKYVNYSKSQEFQDKYQKPYEQRWAAAMSELKELTVEDGQGGARALQPSDILELVNLPLPKAREMATQMFGDFADDVMAHRKEIRSAFEAQAQALEEARKTGSTREQQRREQFQQWQQTVQKEVGEHWTRFNEEATKDERYGKYFTAAEGDDEGNARLEKGFKLVDQAFAENPFAPNLKPEQRADIIKRHAAVRNRAAAFGRLVHRVSQLEAREAELTKELEQYKSTTPETAGGIQPAVTAANGRDTRGAVFNKLRSLAK